MKRLFSPRSPLAWGLIGAVLALGVVFSCEWFSKCLHFWELSPTEKVIQDKMAKEGESYDKLTFDLVDPASAPDGIRDAVMRGYKIIVDTQHEAKAFIGNRLNCTNCHFAGGITTGGRGGGISLAGVAAKYPLFDKRSESVIDLAERINMCFERSMNGKSLPLDSDEMLAVVSYLHWISRNFPIAEKAPWLGVKILTNTHKADPERGKILYNLQCAICHKEHGEGEGAIPPLWGPDSFNDGAGMNKEKVFASFIYPNMPYWNPCLTEEEAIDIAGFVTKQPRPVFNPGK